MAKYTKAVSRLFEYDRTKAVLSCPLCGKFDLETGDRLCSCLEMQRFYGMMDDAAEETINNVQQITPHKSRVKVSAAILNKWADYLDNNKFSNKSFNNSKK